MEEQVFALLGRQKQALAESRDPKAVEDKHYQRDVVVDMFQNPAGFWFIKINGGNPLLATDVEVHLWKELQAIKTRGSEVHHQHVHVTR